MPPCEEKHKHPCSTVTHWKVFLGKKKKKRSILYPGDMRNSQDQSTGAHTQGQQLFSSKEAWKVGAQLIFYERYDDLHIGELWTQSFCHVVMVIKPSLCSFCFVLVKRLFRHVKNELKYLLCFHIGAFDLCTWLSTPRQSSMKKNRGAHNRETGIVERASGYTTKTRPGPEPGHGKAGASIAHEKSGYINAASLILRKQQQQFVSIAVLCSPAVAMLSTGSLYMWAM